MLSSYVFADVQNDLQQVVKGNNSFCFDLYHQLMSEQGNLFFSPYSISTALAMTYAGACGETEKQMADVLHFTSSQDMLHSNYSKLQSDLNSIEEKGEVQLNIANSLWLQKGDPFLDSFLSLNKKYYDAGLYFVDFINANNKARDEINSWVVDETHNKIKNLLKPPLPYKETSLILCNAIYFKGNWLTRFDKTQTMDKDFFLTNDNIIQVSMMLQKSEYRYIDYGSFEGLELPYEGNDLSMIIFLPKEIEGLSELEKYLFADKVLLWIDQLMKTYDREVVVTIPKFKTVCEFELAPSLSDMGMPAAFSPSADFSGINGKHDLFISNVIHKAFVDVNEEGTEAAAATTVVMLKSVAMPSKPLEFRADHPFLFLIRENQTGSILFIGRIVDPRK
jgi:serpin B